MTQAGHHQRHTKTTGGDRFSRVAISFSPEQIKELNALAAHSGRSFSATVAYLVDHALKGRRRSKSAPKGN